MTFVLAAALIVTNAGWFLAYRSLTKRHIQIVSALLEKILGVTE